MALYPAVQDGVNYNGIRSDGSTFGSTISGVDIEISLSIPIPDFYV